jgi:hypothetical protein
MIAMPKPSAEKRDEPSVMMLVAVPDKIGTGVAMKDLQTEKRKERMSPVTLSGLASAPTATSQCTLFKTAKSRRKSIKRER